MARIYRDLSPSRVPRPNVTALSAPRASLLLGPCYSQCWGSTEGSLTGSSAARAPRASRVSLGSQLPWELPGVPGAPRASNVSGASRAFRDPKAPRTPRASKEPLKHHPNNSPRPGSNRPKAYQMAPRAHKGNKPEVFSNGNP